MVKGVDKIRAVHVVTHLLALVAEDLVGRSGGTTLHQVAKKTVKLRAGMIGTGEAAGAEADGLHSEIAAIFLHHRIGRDLGCSKDTVHAAVNRHLLADSPGGKFVRGIDLPARFLFY